MTKVSKRGSLSKQMRLGKDDRIAVGLDVHKKDYKVAVWSCSRESIVGEWVQPPTGDCLVRTLRPYASRVVKVVYEAGPTGFGLARDLCRAGFVVEVVAPSLTPRPAGAVAKSDRLDARLLAQQGAQKLLKAVYVPSEQEESDRQVRRMRQTMLCNMRKTKNRIKSFLLLHGLAEPEGLVHWTGDSVKALRAMDLDGGLRFSLDLLLGDLRHGQEQLRKADAALRVLGGLERHRQAIGLMRTVPGVGPLTAATVRFELPSAQRFDDKEQVAKACGLSPLVRSSGQTRIEGRVTKQGNPRLRTALVEAAWQWVMREPAASRRYQRYVSTTGSKKKSIVAMARRLAIILWRIQITGKPYGGFDHGKSNSDPPAQKPKRKVKHPRENKVAA